MITRSRLSRTNVRAKITGTADDSSTIDPASLTVQLAIVPTDEEPGDTDWHTATHLYGDRFGLLVGPGAPLEPDPGDYDVWRRITDDPEDDIWCKHHIRAHIFDPAKPGLSRLCDFCWSYSQETGRLPSVELMKRRNETGRVPKDKTK